MIAAIILYDSPQAAYLFFSTILIVCLFVLLFQYRKKLLLQFAAAAIIPKLLIPRSAGFYWGKVFALGLAWCLVIFALMEPKGNGHYPSETLPIPSQQVQKNETPANHEAELRRKAHDVIFLIDASASMSVMDSRNGNSRLEYAKEIVDEVVSRLTGETAALFAFTSVLTKLVPLTSDYLYLRLMLKEMHINEGDATGTDIKEALKDLRKLYYNKFSKELKTVLLFTDGGDNFLDTLQGKARENEINNIAQLVSPAKELNLRVFTIGMGSKKGKEIPGITYEGKPVNSSLDEELLKKISLEGRGEYYFANAFSSLDLAEDISRRMQQDNAYITEGSLKASYASSDKPQEDLIYDLYFQVPLGLAIILIVFCIILPDNFEKSVERKNT